MFIWKKKKKHFAVYKLEVGSEGVPHCTSQPSLQSSHFYSFFWTFLSLYIK